MKKIAVPLAFSVILLGGTIASAQAPAAAPAAPAAPAAAAPVKPPPPKKGDMIPEFTAVNYPDEKQVSGKDIVGSAKVTALVFFNTGCSSCLAELTEASTAVKSVNDPSKLAVFGIAVDKRGAKSVQVYDESNKFSVKYLLDTEFKIPPMFGFRYTPAMVIVDKSGKIMEVKGGFDPAADKGTVQNMLIEMAK